ncbi:allene oxide cyclase barrel-like domain-containing protein [Nocardia asiatica]|uniref:allene oxide cyclase barrel-like domain-containing protein n=1 Tax=Nocardia asiatica TaxID=209252 RepID=UPI0005BDD25C|nr:hypothetical protein [Nocardia asiatica]
MHNNIRTKAAFTTFVAAPLIAIAVGGCGANTSETEARADDQVEILELGVENDQYASLDLGQPGVSVGDMDVYSGNAIQDGRTVGRGGGSCQTLHIEGENITTQCSITMELTQGSVTMQSQWVRGASPLDMAITGGTGVYREARGTVRFWDIGTPNERARAEIIR